MKLSDHDAMARLVASDHGVLCTLHAERGVDALPAVFAVSDDRWVGVPVDLVKPKTSTRLQRERNLEGDPRATLVVDRWDPDDWSQLWWVRAQLCWHGSGADVADRAARLGDLLERRYPQYRGQPFARVLVFEIEAVSGWSAAG